MSLTLIASWVDIDGWFWIVDLEVRSTGIAHWYFHSANIDAVRGSGTVALTVEISKYRQFASGA